jgi:hypothetical protein
MTSPPYKSRATAPGRTVAVKTIDDDYSPTVNAPGISVNTFCVHAIDQHGRRTCFYVEAQTEASAWQEAVGRRGVGVVQSVERLSRECGVWQ